MNENLRNWLSEWEYLLIWTQLLKDGPVSLEISVSAIGYSNWYFTKYCMYFSSVQRFVQQLCEYMERSQRTVTSMKFNNGVSICELQVMKVADHFELPDGVQPRHGEVVKSTTIL